MNTVKSLCIGLAFLSTGTALCVDKKVVVKKTEVQKTAQPAQLNQVQAMKIQEAIGANFQKFRVDFFATNFDVIESFVKTYAKNSKSVDAKIATLAKEFASKNSEAIKKGMVEAFEKVLGRSLTEQEQGMFVTAMISNLDQFFEALVKEDVFFRSKVLVKVEELKKSKTVAKK